MKSLKTRGQFATFFSCLILLLSTVGCSTLDWGKWKKSEFVEASAKNPASEVFCIWQPAEGKDMKGMPTRGFAGQILFFTRSSPAPVAVEGDVRVYVFDDQGTEEERSKPIHQFDFPALAWNSYLQKSNIGVGYHLFIPYTRKGHHEARCTLRVRFAPKDGSAIYSEAADVTLNGTKKEKPEESISHVSQARRGEDLTRQNAIRSVDISNIAKQLNKKQAKQQPNPKNSGIQLAAAEEFAEDDHQERPRRFNTNNSLNSNDRIERLRAELQRLSAKKKQATAARLKHNQGRRRLEANSDDFDDSTNDFSPDGNENWFEEEIDISGPAVSGPGGSTHPLLQDGDDTQFLNDQRRIQKQSVNSDDSDYEEASPASQSSIHPLLLDDEDEF